MHSLVLTLLLAPAVAGAADFSAPGPHPVGFAIVPLTKRSETTGEPRRLDTLVWYPAAADGAAPGEVVPDAVVRRGRWPLVVFSHGSCGIAGQSPFYTVGLASWGFVVAAPPHPGNTFADPDCFSGAGLADSFANRPADVSFVIDALIGFSRERHSWLSRRLNPRRIGVTGHSFGGQTTLRVAAGDARIRAGVALAPAQIGGLAIDVPMMVIGGEVDSITPFDTASRASYALARGPRFLVQIQDSGHCAFAGLCVAQFCGVGCGPEFLPPEQAHDRTLDYAVPFFLRYLAGGHSRLESALLPAAARPGARVIEARPRG